MKMNEYDLKAVMEEVHERDFAEFGSASAHRFSLRHSRAIKKILSLEGGELSARSTAQAFPKAKIRLDRKTAVLIIAAILFALISGCTAAYFISDGFRGNVYSTNTHLFALNTENAPTEIIKEFHLSILPEGYELIDSDISSYHIYRNYENSDGDSIVFTQQIKESFNPHLNTEKFTLEETDVNGCAAVCAQYESSGKPNALMIWDNGDYILEIFANMTKEELKELAIQNEINNEEQ